MTTLITCVKMRKFLDVSNSVNTLMTKTHNQTIVSQLREFEWYGVCNVVVISVV